MGRFLVLEIALTLLVVVFLLQHVIYTPPLAGLCNTPFGDIGAALSPQFAEICGKGYIVAGILDLAGWLYLFGIILLIVGVIIALR